jgi:Flp pilus assembly protein TadD
MKTQPSRAQLIALVLGLSLAGLAASARAGGIPPMSLAEERESCTIQAEEGLRSRTREERQAAGIDEADGVLVEIETELCMARFAEALDRVREGRSRLAGLPDSWPIQRRRALLEVQAATARIALGQNDSAELHFHWALELDPYLELDPQRTSPKVIRSFEAARSTWVASR